MPVDAVLAAGASPFSGPVLQGACLRTWWATCTPPVFDLVSGSESRPPMRSDRQSSLSMPMARVHGELLCYLHSHATAGVSFTQNWASRKAESGQIHACCADGSSSLARIGKASRDVPALTQQLQSRRDNGCVVRGCAGELFV